MRRLNEAALAGNVSSLLELLEQDELILDKVMVDSVADNPLHIASILGHVDFAREVLSRKPELARELNSQGSSSLHLASAKGHVEMAKELLKINADFCLLRDQYGRTPLHVAAIKGQVGVINELIHVKPESPSDLTDEGETILHLCVKFHQLEAMKVLVQSVNGEHLQSKDKDGNTVLHLAVAKRHIQMIKFLLRCPGTDVNVLNENGVTALDVLLQSATQLCDIEIGEILRGAGVVRARELSGSARHHILAIPEMAPLQQSPALPQQESRRKKKKKKMKNTDDWVEKYGNTLMLVAMLIATMTFEAGMNPPGGECDKLNANCTVIKWHVRGNETYNFSYSPVNYDEFLFVDTVGFLSSLAIIVLIISGFPLRRRFMRWVLWVTIMIAIYSVVFIFFEDSIFAIQPNSFLFNIHPTFFWFVSVGGLLVSWQLVRFGKWLLRKCGIISKRERKEEEEGMA